MVGLVETYLKLFRLELTVTLTQVISMVVLVFTFGLILVFIGFFASLALAYFMATWFSIAVSYSLLLVAGIYLLLFLGVLAARSTIRQFIFAVIERIINQNNE